MSGVSPFPTGGISLVGAGPGDPELITLRGYRRLQQSEVLVYDNLVSPAVVDYAPPDAERIYVGKSAGRHTLAQKEINQLLLTKVRTGKRVVRLKGGDPFVFGRGGEEMDLLLENGVAVEIVPGITAALGAAASFGFPLTHRDYAQSCMFVTGHLKDHSVDLNWQALAQPKQTLVIYMGVTGLDTVVRELQAAGLPGGTPAALIYRATWPEQKAFPAMLATLIEAAVENAVKPPALIVIGEVTRLLYQERSPHRY